MHKTFILGLYVAANLNSNQIDPLFVGMGTLAVQTTLAIKTGKSNDA